eukprot:55974_1
MSTTTTTTTTESELVVFYYIRNEYESKFNKITVPMALKYLIVSFSNRIIGSKLLTTQEDSDFVQLLQNKIPIIGRFNLLFRASENGFKAKDFHNQCDNYGSTITIIKSNFGNIFGGYTNIPWTSAWTELSHYADPNSFLFLIRANKEKNQNNCPLIFEIKHGHAKSDKIVFHDTGCGPIFGGGH